MNVSSANLPQISLFSSTTCALSQLFQFAVSTLSPNRPFDPSWRLFCASRGPCAHSCQRRHPPHSARSLPPLLRLPLTTSPQVRAACRTSRFLLDAAPSWARPSPSKALVVGVVLLPVLSAVCGLTTPASTELSCTPPRPKKRRL
jgi:hypothetical protein